MGVFVKHENDLSDTRKGDILAATGECPSPVVVSNLTGVVKVILSNSIRKNQRRLGVGFCVSKTMNYVNVSKKAPRTILLSAAPASSRRVRTRVRTMPDILMLPLC